MPQGEWPLGVSAAGNQARIEGDLISLLIINQVLTILAM
jgi:hypothetical protein